MRALRGLSAVLLVLVCAAGAADLQATTLLHMNLSELAGRAEKIFKGTVVDVKSGTAHIGGVDLPTMKYTFQVHEWFAGDYTVVTNKRLVEIQMIRKVPPVRVANAVRISPLPDIPPLDKGNSYLLFTTLPSHAGLSAPVGLGQGWFRLSGDPGNEQAVNGFNNFGLFSGMNVQGMPDKGPIAYTELADQIRLVLEKQ